jgi:hypothetical protein
VTKSGPKILGDAKNIVVVKTDPGYTPNPALQVLVLSWESFTNSRRAKAKLKTEVPA